MRIAILYILILVQISTAALVNKTITISNKIQRTTTSGEIINVHEGHLVQWKENGLFYFYGMSYELCNDSTIKCNNAPYCGWTYDHNISVYSSKDLSNNGWTFEGYMFDTTTTNRDNGTYFRMYSFYNQNTNKYIIWTMNNNKGHYVVLQSNNPLGPFEIVSHNVQMSQSGKHGDFYGFVDDNNKAYIVYNTGGIIAVDELDETYTNSTKKTTGLFPNIANEDKWQEAPLMFKRNGKYYVLTGAGCCVCKKGSDSNLWISENGPVDKYKYINNIGKYNNGTLITGSQMGFLATIKQSNGEIMYIEAGDRWQQAVDNLHGHDPQIWQPLKFNSDGTIHQLEKLDEFKITITINE